MPEAHATLWFMGTFLALWGITLIVRGAAGERRGPGRQCPACSASLAAGSLNCAACGYDAPNERAVRSRRRSWPMVMCGVGVQAVAAGAFIAGQRVYVWSHQDPSFDPGLTLWDCAALGTVAFSAVLIAWALVGDRSRGRRRCPGCWYDMAGITNLRCPECGRESVHTRDLYRARRRWRWVPVGVAGLLMAAGLWEVPRYRAGGPVALVPTTALIAGLWQLPDSCILQDRSGAWSEDWALLARLQGSRVATWQQNWLVWRVEGVIKDPDTPERFARASRIRSQWWDAPDSQTWSNDVGRGAVRTFVRWISGPDADLRSRAAASFECLFYLRWGPPGLGLEPEEVEPHVPGLKAAMAGGGLAAQCAAYILSGTPAHHQAVIDFAVSTVSTWPGGPSYHAAIFSQVANTGGAAIAREAATRMLQSQAPNERLLAVNVLHRAFAADPSSRDLIRSRLNDPDDGVVKAVFWIVLSEGGQATIGPELVSAIRERPTPGGRQALLGFLQGRGAMIAAADLTSLLESEPDAAVQATLCQLIQQVAWAGREVAPAMPALHAAARSQDSAVAQAASAALATIQSRGLAGPTGPAGAVTPASSPP